jgi:hypothetical protein
MPPDATAVVPESRTPELGELFDKLGVSVMRKLRVALPGRIESYDAAKQLVRVKPLLKEISDSEEGDQSIDSLPVLNNVPVVFPGGGGFRVTFPIKVGDVVLLVFNDRSLDVWKSKGGEVDPLLFNRHHLADAVAIPGLHDNTAAWLSADPNVATIGVDNGTFEGVGLGATIQSFLSSLKTFLDTHIHPFVGVAPGVPSTTQPTTPASPSVPTVASQTVKVSQ